MPITILKEFSYLQIRGEVTLMLATTPDTTAITPSQTEEPTVLVVDDAAIIREPIAITLRHAGFNVLQATDGIDAFAVLKQYPVQLILLDVAMPRLDGLSLLARLRQDPAYKTTPVILLTAVEDKQQIIRAGSLGVRDYLLKSRFSLSELLTRVERLLTMKERPNPPREIAEHDAPRQAGRPFASVAVPATSARRQEKPTSSAKCPVLLHREQTLARLNSLQPSRTLAGVVDQVIRLASSARSDLSDLVAVIESDPVLASRVIQLANSAAFTSQRARVANVEEAVRNVGVKTVQKMAMSVGVFENFPTDTGDGFNSMRCWQHCYGTALMMNLLMEQVEPESHAELHLIGLCHDLGDLLLRQHFAAEYEILSGHARETGTSMHVLEAQALGMRHDELAVTALSKLGLPQNVTTPIREFLEREAHPNAKMGMHARALAMANSMVNALQLSASPDERITPIFRSEWRLLAGDKPPPLLDSAGLRSQILTTTNVLARLPSRDETRFMKPHIASSDARIWYVRHAGFLDPDPIEIALQSLAEVTVSPCLPSGSNQWGQCSAVVMLGPRPEAAPLISIDVHAARSQAGVPACPIFFLCGQDQPVPTIPNIRLMKYPVCISELAKIAQSAATERLR